MSVAAVEEIASELSLQSDTLLHELVTALASPLKPDPDHRINTHRGLQRLMRTYRDHPNELLNAYVDTLPVSAAFFLMVIDDEDDGREMVLRRRMWEEGVSSEDFSQASSLLLQRGCIAVQWRERKFTFTPMGEWLITAARERIGQPKID